MNNRIEKLIDLMEKDGLDAVMLSGKANIFYFSGFTSEDATLIITKKEQFIITDFRYYDQARLQAKDYVLVDVKGGIQNVLTSTASKNVGVEDTVITLFEYNTLTQSNKSVSFTGMADKINLLRMIKDKSELETIKTAEMIASNAFEQVLPFIKPGITERNIAVMLERYMAESGASGTSFETIVASGERGSMPHGTASDRIIQCGDLVTMDFGCVYNGYCSDMTRTVAIGNISDEKKTVYNIVKDAQQNALDAIKPGMICSDVDSVARDYISEQGYSKCFGHGLGHGVGVEIHEKPNLSLKCDIKLEPDMVVTVEPGIYIAGKFGVRIEDLVRVTEDGFENFTKSSKELLII